MAIRLPNEKCRNLYTKLQHELTKCCWTPNLISAGVTIIHKFSENKVGISNEEINRWSEKIMKECCNYICRISETKTVGKESPILLFPSLLGLSVFY